MRSLTFVLLLSSLAFACNKSNPNFCGPGEDCTGIDAPTDGPPVSCTTSGPDPSCPAANPVCVDGQCTGGCTSDNDCAARPADERLCLIGPGACVECDENNEQAALPLGDDDECPSPDMAVCDGTTHTCRACTAHTECTSGICDAGRCAAESEVVFMRANAAGGGGCGSRALPCLTLNEAIDRVQANNTLLRYIFMEPSATSYIARQGSDGTADLANVDVYILAEGATVTRASGDGSTIDISGGSVVRIDGLTVTGGSGSSGAGIEMAGSTLTLYEASVSNNDYRGITATTSTLNVSRSRILSNDGGGISLDAGKISLVNNVIGGNGDLLASPFGGLSLNLTETPNTIEFNTIVANSASGGVADGVTCNNPAVIARNNIIIGAATNLQTSGSCMHRFTLVTPNSVAPMTSGEGVMTVATQVMYNFTPDFHIQAGSVAIGKAQATNLTGELLFDIDGDSRTPDGTTVDVGADEIP